MKAPLYKDLEAAKQRFCPFCDEPLLHHEGFTTPSVDVCDKCGTSWFDRGELQRSKMHLGLPTHSEIYLLERVWWRDTNLRCPKCDIPNLRKGTISGRRIAHCETCRGFLIERPTLEVERVVRVKRGLWAGFTRVLPESWSAPAWAAPVGIMAGLVAVILAWGRLIGF